MMDNNQLHDQDSNVHQRANAGKTSKRGFASMSPEQQREIASKGGQAAHRQGVAHEWNSEEAREAGRKGGQASRRDRSLNDEGAPGVPNNNEDANIDY